jgi:hypothetical protein
VAIPPCKEFQHSENRPLPCGLRQWMCGTTLPRFSYTAISSCERYITGKVHSIFILFIIIFFLLSFDDCEEKRFYSPDSVPPALANKHTTTFILAHAQGRVLADGVTFRHGEPNGGGWFWWWNWRAFACMLLALVLVGVGTLGTMVRYGRGCNCTRCCCCCCCCLLLCSLSLSHTHTHTHTLACASIDPHDPFLRAEESTVRVEGITVDSGQCPDTC